ncbi:oligogalacturonide lyase [Bryobacterales bacterium F-183]|nr:oligogalacturonide lyase [Bryobacterales bacterium F-183]
MLYRRKIGFAAWYGGAVSGFVKGALFPSEHSTYACPATGATIHQLTNAGAISHPSYFLQRSFTGDNSRLVFTSYRADGKAQLFDLAFPDGEIRQLTDGGAIHPFSPALLGSKVLFVRIGSIWEIDLETLAERHIVTFDNAQLGECSFSSDGEWITAAVKQGSQSGIVTGRRDGTQWRLIPYPRTVIHPQFHPVDSEWIIFAGDPAPRMHRVRRDGTGMECLYEHTNDEFVVHETFLGETGDILYTVWPFHLRRMDWETREIANIADFNAWHIAPNRAGTKVLCDTNHPDLGIHLVDVASGERQLICLSAASNGGSQWKTSRYALAEDFAAARSNAKQNLSWMEASTDTVYGPQWTHPHPSFSPDERWITFASDRSGVTQVYAVEVPR